MKFEYIIIAWSNKIFRILGELIGVEVYLQCSLCGGTLSNDAKSLMRHREWCNKFEIIK